MATYAVGDIQGCYSALKELLDSVDFSPSRDTLWAAGDLINRGPENLNTLNYLHSLGDAFKCVLGNHDLHFLAVAKGSQQLKRKDTIQDLLTAKNHQTLVDWLLQQPLIHHDDHLNITMVHAGIPPIWSLKEALERGEEVQKVLKSKHAKVFFDNMYGNTPNIWHKKLNGAERLRIITNYFTRMRFCDAEGQLELETKTGPQQAPKGFAPWFSYRDHKIKKKTVIFGHWASLEGNTNTDHFIALDTGCVWGGALTMLNLKTKEKIFIDCDCNL